MKFTSRLPAVFAFVFPFFVLSVSAQTEPLTYDTTYDDASLPLTEVACSDGVHGLITQGYTTIGSLPDFPNLGGAYTVTGWNSPACGTCYNLTYGGRSLFVLAIDVALEGFNLSEEAMNTLTGGEAVDLGRVEVTSVQVDASYCGL